MLQPASQAPPPLTRLQSRVVWASWAVGGLLRLLYIVVWHPATRFISSDMLGYVSRARAFAAGQPQTIADTIYPPGASIFFGLIYRLDSTWALSFIVQWLLSLGIMGMLWWLARRLYGNAAAVVTLVLAALYFPAMHYAALFLAENPFTFLLLATLCLFLRALLAASRGAAVGWALLTGLSAGTAASFKTTILGPLMVTGLLFAAHSVRHRRAGWLPMSAALLLGVAALFVPMSLHCTKLMEGRFCLAATNGPMNILQGHYGEKFMFYWRDQQRNYYFNFGSPTASLHGWTDSVHLDFGAYDSAANMKLVREYIAAHPGAALLQSFGNVLDLFTGRTIWPQASLWHIDFGATFQLVFALLILPAALWRIGARWRPMMDLRADAFTEWLLLGPLLGVMLLAFIGEGEVRYRIPFDGLLMILAARSYVGLYTRLSGGAPGETAAAAAGAIPPPPPEPSAEPAPPPPTVQAAAQAAGQPAAQPADWPPRLYACAPDGATQPTMTPADSPALSALRIAPGQMPAAAPEVSLVIPMHNESAGLDHLFGTLLPIVRNAAATFEIVVVNDGSTDDTLAALLRLQPGIPQLRVIDLSRNFGKEAALTAGLRHCRGACAITLDADLQDPPELIVEMLARWREGYETVVAVHHDRQTDPYVRRQLSRGFYRLLNAVSEMRFVPHAGDFRLLDRAVVEAFLELPERTRFNKGLFAWIGFRHYLIEHHRPARKQGQSTFNTRRLLHLAADAITSFSLFPLRLWMYVGTIISTAAMLYGVYIVLRTLIRGTDVPGYASTIVAVMFLGGMNLLSVGVLGAYIGRVFLESKQRPLYVVRRAHEPAPGAGSAAQAE